MVPLRLRLSFNRYKNTVNAFISAETIQKTILFLHLASESLGYFSRVWEECYDSTSLTQEEKTQIQTEYDDIFNLHQMHRDKIIEEYNLNKGE